MLLFEGLDEVPSAGNRARVVSWIAQQVAAYPSNIAMATSRPAGYLDLPLNTALIMRLEPFSNEQIHRFLLDWA